MKNDYKGYALFNDVQDEELRAHNRAVVMLNLLQDHSRDKKISEQGLSLLREYFDNIPQVDRFDTYAKFQQEIKDRGYAEVKH